MRKTRYKYVLVLPSGATTEWTGIFNTIEDAEAWHDKWGKMWEERGRKLRLAKTNDAQEQRIRQNEKRFRL